MSGPRVGLTADFAPTEGQVESSWGPIGLDRLDELGIEWSFLPADDGTLTATDLAGFDAVVVGAPAVTAASVSGTHPPRVVARFGVGYDSVDLEACTAAGVAVTITPDGARRPVAAATVAMVLALTHHVVVKDRLVRESRWSDRMAWMGVGVNGRTLGMVGIGNIGSETAALLRPFGLEVVAYDPWADEGRVSEVGARLVSLEELLTISDIVVLTAALTPQTHHLIDAEALTQMKPGAFLVNMARGPLIDTDALVSALTSGDLGGAGLDVFEDEPLPADHRLLELDNVLLSPHSLAWTDELALGNGRSALRAVEMAITGRVPDHLVNPDVLAHSSWADHARA